MKTYEIPWSVGAMFICNKCGIAFNEPENAEKLKLDLRTYLKENDQNKKIRVMVSGCLNVCKKEEQAISFQPVLGSTKMFTVDQNYNSALIELKSILDKKIANE